MVDHRVTAFVTLGAVVLCVTGSRALQQHVLIVSVIPTGIAHVEAGDRHAVARLLRLADVDHADQRARDEPLAQGVFMARNSSSPLKQVRPPIDRTVMMGRQVTF